jgi:hypothetical protein
MTDWQINSALLAAHNIAKALGALATVAALFVFMGPIFWSFKSK